MRREDGRAEIASVLRAVSSPIRLSIIEALNTSQMNFSELIKYSGLSERGDVGKFTYHLKTLLRTGLIEYSSKSRVYSLTPLGRRVVEVVRNLQHKSVSGELVMLNWDYSIMPINRNIIAEHVVEAVQIPADLARRVGILVEKRLVELQTLMIPRWLFEDLLRVELLSSNVELEKISNIMPSGPTIRELYTAFHKSVDKNCLKSLNNYMFDTAMRTLVVEKLFQKQLKQHYYLGEFDLYPIARGPAQIFSISLTGYEEFVIQKVMDLVCNDLVVRIDVDSEIGPYHNSYFPYPENIYFLIEGSASIIARHSEKRGNGHRLGEVLKRCEWADKVGVGLPVRESSPILYTFYRGDRTLFTQYAIKTSVSGGFGVHSFIGLNILRLLSDGEFDESIIIQRVSPMLERLGRYLERCTHYLYKFHKEAPRMPLLYLMAPVGLVEALRLLSTESSKAEEGYNLLARVLKSLSEAINSVSSLRGRVIIASSWPQPLSDRLYSIDKALATNRFYADTEIQEPLNRYCNSLSEIFLTLCLDHLQDLAQLLGGIVMEDALVERLMELHGREPVLDLLQSLPILLRNPPEESFRSSVP
ncbi:MAG: winged helix-turn-helix domain-containing protein [Nitrososphaerota archaeon]